ncbi:protein RnfH [Shewanella mangrovi]|uniref:UPF0125 protein HR45_06555 n=1 Tax=Shewanella mangrovi TaxID=1515746 RepID=A0A094LSJ0_9GAMM|nr:RnfH family protein [Shewanella mangrovi]KFZ38158.1 protein RnfH [Shewanella mangrovi]
MFPVDVIYAKPNQQKVITVTVTQGTTFKEAVEHSGIVAFFPEIELDNLKLGSFSNQVKPTDEVKPGQRIEIYRPLIADPKEVRRRRADKAKEEGRINKTTGAKIS